MRGREEGQANESSSTPVQDTIKGNYMWWSVAWWCGVVWCGMWCGGVVPPLPSPYLVEQGAFLRAGAVVY